MMMFEEDGGPASAMLGQLFVVNQRGEKEVQQVVHTGKTLYQDVFIRVLEAASPMMYANALECLNDIESAGDAQGEADARLRLDVEIQSGVSFSALVASRAMRFLHARQERKQAEIDKADAENEHDDEGPRIVVPGDN